MHGRRLLAVIAILALALVAAALPASGDDPTAPNGLDQAPRDGCQRNAVGLLTFTSPEWVFIRGEENTHFVEGDILEDGSHPAPGGGDLPEGHEWYDYNGDLKITDPSQAYLAGIDNDTGRPFDAIHTERESGQIPVATWMTADDHASIWGSWIWDCGHWGKQSLDPTSPEGRDFLLPGQGGGEGSVPGDTGADVGHGETAEFHPVKAYAITRRNPYFSPVEQTETDFYVSNYGTTAHAEEYCAKRSTKAGFAMGPDYTECLQDPRNRHWDINDTDYSFFVPAPPKPPGATQLRVTVLDNPGNVGPAPQPVLDVRSDGVQVTIPFKGFPGVAGTPQCPVQQTNPQHAILPPYDCPSQALSKAFFVGWEGGQQRIPADVELTLKKVTVHNALDTPGPGTSSQVPPGEYGINMDANGLWAYVNDYQTGLDQVNDGDSFDINRTFRLRVKDGGRLRVFFPTRECDLPHMNPCFATPEAAEDNDGPGDVKAVFPSVAAAVGDHVVKGGPSDAPNWEMTYSIRQVAPARVDDPATAGPPGGPVGDPVATTYPNAGAPGSGAAGSNDAGRTPQGGTLAARAGCVDSYSPRSRFRGPNRRDSHRSPVRASRRGISLRGRAEDRDCHRKPGAVKRVEVAIARRVGKRCSFLGTGGRFGRPAKCSVPRGFRAVHGTKSWRYSKKVRLRRGRYLAFSRATDPAGNVEYRAHTGNRARFSVR